MRIRKGIRKWRDRVREASTQRGWIALAPSRAAGPRCGFLKLWLPHRALQELLDRLRDRVSELQAEQLRVEPLQQGQGLEETWDSPAAAPAGFLGPHHSILRALRGPKMMRDSGCFGRRLDRIGSLSGLGCNGEHLSPFQLHIIRATSGSDVSGDQILNKEHHSSLLAVLRAKACLSGNIKFGQHSLSCLGVPSIHLLPLTERGRITLGCNSVTIQQALLGAENS